MVAGYSRKCRDSVLYFKSPEFWVGTLSGSVRIPLTLLRVPSLQAVFLRAVKLYNSGDFRGSTEDMERALAEYLAVFARCLAGCEGAHEQVDFKDFYPAIAGTFHPDPSGHPSHPQGPELLRPLDTNIHSTRISRGLLSA